MNYGDFKTLLASYLHRSDLTSMLPTFVEHGRLRMSQELRVQEMETYATVTLTSGVGALSSDLVAIRHVQGPTRRLEWVNLDNLLTVSTESAYTVVGLDIRAPGCATVDVYYWERPQTLVGAADSATRTVLSLYTQLWLYAALVEAAIYTQDPELEQSWQTRLDAEITRANNLASRVRHGSRPVLNDAGINVMAGGSGL